MDLCPWPINIFAFDIPTFYLRTIQYSKQCLLNIPRHDNQNFGITDNNGNDRNKENLNKKHQIFLFFRGKQTDLTIKESVIQVSCLNWRQSSWQYQHGLVSNSDLY